MHTFTNSLDLSLRFGTEVAVHDDRLDLGVGDDVHIPHGVVAALHATNKGDHLCAITMRRKNEHEVGSDRDNPHQSWWQQQQSILPSTATSPPLLTCTLATNFGVGCLYHCPLHVHFFASL